MEHIPSTFEDLGSSPKDTKMTDVVLKPLKPGILSNGVCLSSIRL